MRVILDDKSMFLIRLMMKLKFVILNADGGKMKKMEGTRKTQVYNKLLICCNVYQNDMSSTSLYQQSTESYCI